MSNANKEKLSSYYIFKYFKLLHDKNPLENKCKNPCKTPFCSIENSVDIFPLFIKLFLNIISLLS